MNKNTSKRQRGLRSSYLPGLVAAFIVVTLAVIFWSDFRALPRGWQFAIGVVSVTVVLRMLVAGCDLDRSEVALANALCGQGQYERALGELARVIANNPTNAEAFYVKGQCLDGLGRRDEAMAAWLEALRHNPTHGRSAHDLACEYVDRGDYVKAAEYFAIARQGGACLVEPATFRQNVESTKNALIHLGREAEDRGDRREVLRYVDAIIQLEPDHAIAHAWRSQMKLALGDCQGAVEDARSCLRLNPKYEKARILLAAAKEALNADIAASQLRPGLPRSGGGAQFAGTTTPTLPKENGDRSHAPLGNRRALWKVGDIAFDHWEIRRIITHGGMGTIYAAWD
ncbi:MAG: tetratricopeptide repeat protein, partial [Dehalococcoidia bacterium]